MGVNMSRKEFMDLVYSELHDDGDNYRANRIIDAADEYVDSKVEEIRNVILQRNEYLMKDKEYRRKRGDIDLLGVLPYIK